MYVKFCKLALNAKTFYFLPANLTSAALTFNN
jgi:hypothetical protein